MGTQIQDTLARLIQERKLNFHETVESRDFSPIESACIKINGEEFAREFEVFGVRRRYPQTYQVICRPIQYLSKEDFRLIGFEDIVSYERAQHQDF